ncbi:ABC transporter permease [Nocardioides sp. Kera G14]|uniref:ABC transporter permease n=1 Tax=Nocardioides sp. Kera G14 TaxID=2884264 RepID=UPI001D106337|nr:ABC transporter permease [Nocardioides sp. Kera G14]UDY24699.1 ABC transporter permease [Nocardioides sp. Kera G14]
MTGMSGMELAEANELNEVVTTKVARSRGAIVWARLRRAKRFWIGAIVILLLVLWAAVGPLFYQWDPVEQDAYNLNWPPTTLHWFGTNDLGQDIFSQTMQGLRKSLIIGFVGGLVSTFLSATIGSFAGYIGGRSDKVIAWFINLMLVLPTLFVLIILYPVTKGSWIVLTCFLAITSWMVMAQTVRMQTRALREREFVKASRYMGFGSWHVIRTHVLPNVMSILLIDATISIGDVILSETGLSFIGFGVQPPDVSLGTLLDGGWTAATTRPWLFLFPSGVLVILLLAINLVGDALRDALDPRGGGRG